MPRSKTPPALATLIFLTAFSTLSLNMFLPSLANIAADLEASYATVSLALAGYLAITAVIQLIVGPLSDRIGRRPVLLVALLVFTGASVICALATDIRIFLAFRMLQGGIIAGYALSLAIIRDTTSERKAAGLIGYISMAMAIAPMLGPMLGGVLDTAFGWRANFWFYAVSGLVLFAICWFDLGETRPAEPGADGANPGRMRDLLRAPLFWAFSFCSAFSTGAFYIFLTGCAAGGAGAIWREYCRAWVFHRHDHRRFHVWRVHFGPSGPATCADNDDDGGAVGGLPGHRDGHCRHSYRARVATAVFRQHGFRRRRQWHHDAQQQCGGDVGAARAGR